ncbi:MAG: hypothetical protein EA341_12055 [Mongoliibacter sp.]|uniref:hypothetical protein n=1 Tax=Mongoliibacter sp. TaxID=2022438 RepID=UPI0012EFF17C|nr:hypothetical protein [Mongoliibacter sp.]TVP47788.1 MAG: hypothetical protein EA341_12055 [Mongoliibacter sp.]
MNKFLLLLGAFLGFYYSNSYAQSRIKLEMYTGPQYSYQKLVNDPVPSLNFENVFANHVGLGLLYGLGGDWQLSLQSEFTGLAYNYDGFIDFPDGREFRTLKVRGGNLWHHRLGLRKNWEKGNHAFYVQPSFGVSLLRYSELNVRDSVSSIQFFTYRNSVVANAALDAGVKFYTKSKNYFTIGVRHQQGLGELKAQEFNWMGHSPNPQLQRRGSYTGLVLGYGIDFKGKSIEEKEERKAGRVQRKIEKRQAAWGDGFYLMATGLLRFQSKSEREPNLEFSHISGGNEFLLGYTFGQVSLESGYGRLNAYTNAVLEDGALNIHTPTDYTVGVIPVRLRYHWDIGSGNKFRVGASGAAMYTLGTKGMAWYTRGIYSETGQFRYALSSVPYEESSEGKVFFNAGVFTEIPIFNSSMLTLNFSRNFNSPQVGKVNVFGEVNGEPVSLDAAGSLNGWILELGYKLPLNSIFK